MYSGGRFAQTMGDPAILFLIRLFLLLTRCCLDLGALNGDKKIGNYKLGEKLLSSQLLQTCMTMTFRYIRWLLWARNSVQARVEILYQV